MARTSFSGPVKSDNGFEGDITGAVTGAVAATTLTTTGAVSIDGTTVIITDLPAADPEVVGQLWNDSGVLTVSAG
jgi:hypothetical protein